MKDWIVLLGLIAVATGLGVWHRQAAAKGTTDPVTGVVRAAVVPVQSGVARVSDSVSDFVWGVTHARSLKAENERLKARVQNEEQGTARIAELEAELARLRKLNDFAAKSNQNGLRADIVAFYVEQDTMTINLGANQGLKHGNTVMGPGGVVGLVTAVNSNSAQVSLITALESSVGIRVQRSRTIGVCEGQGDGNLTLKYLASDADVKEGDLIVTSGLGQVYPKGLVVGRVDRVWLDPVYNMKRASVKPAVDSERLEEVIVLK